MTINKQACDKLKSAAAKAVDNFDPNMFVETRDVLALTDDLEAVDRRNADLETLLEAEVRLWTQRYECANSRREVAEKRVAELEGREVVLPDYTEIYQDEFAKEVKHQVRAALKSAGISIKGE